MLVELLRVLRADHGEELDRFAAGVTRIVYGDAIRKHTSPEGAERQAKIAAEHGTRLTENVPPAPRGAAPYARWLKGEDTKLFPRPEVWSPKPTRDALFS